MLSDAGVGQPSTARRHHYAAPIAPARPFEAVVLRAHVPAEQRRLAVEGADRPSRRTRRNQMARQRKRARTRVAAARCGAGGWVVDTGASRHVCPPAAACGPMRPTRMRVDTANGTIAADGEATAHVAGLQGDVDVVVMVGAPKLLSVGQLVQQGHALEWGPGGCSLSTPEGRTITLDVVDGIPVLQDEATLGPGAMAPQVAAHVGAVRDGVSTRHQQEGHYPWRSDCSVCCDAAMRSTQHRRRLPHAGVLAIDLAALGTGGPRVLVGVTQLPGWTYAEPVRGKAAADLREPVLRMVAEAKQRGAITKLRADREGGIEALEADLLALGVRLSLTQGRDPQANGTAEQAVGRLSQMAHAASAHISDQIVAAALWPSAMVWAAQRLAGHKLPPFGALALARHPPMAPLGKLGGRASKCVLLHKST